jgi:NAD(P)H-dependent FMN reductase
MAKQIGIIIGSTRINRIGPKVADFVKSTLESQKDNSTVFSLIDINTFKLPLLDEAAMPATVMPEGGFAGFTHDHSKAWSNEIARYDGYVFTTPEWNFGVPGSTKNAIDYLYHAWIGKPVLVVSYGIKGGKTASESLKAILSGMHLQVAETRPSFTFPGADPANRNFSPSLMAAMGGELHPDSLEAWKADTAELEKGYGELKTLLGAVDEVATVGC